MANRRTKGSGSITQARDKGGKPRRGYWNVQVSRYDADGERHRTTRTVQGTKRDAEAKLKELLREQEEGVKVEKQSSLRFGSYAREWHRIKAESGNLAKSSIVREGECLDTICEYWEDMLLADITPKSIERLYIRIKADKTKKYGHYSGSSMAKIHIALNQVLRDAVNNDYLLKNPCDKVKQPKLGKADRKALSPLDIARLLKTLNAAEDAEYEAFEAKEARKEHRSKGELIEVSEVFGLSRIASLMAVRIALASGMRRGEVLALTWGNVEIVQTKDGINGTLKVRKSITNFGEVKDPKTKAGVRNVSIDPETALRLRRWASVQASVLGQLNLKQTTETPVCCSNTGDFMKLPRFTRWWATWREDNGFSGLKFHELRHTQASVLLANGVDLKTVQKRGGWATSSILLDVYAHALEDNDRCAANVMANVFATKEEPSNQSTEDAQILSA